MNIKSALVAIAKDEENYIDEWIRYNLKIGFDDIFIYQNDWRYRGKYLNNERIHLIECDGIAKQNFAYNNFIENYHTQFDFAAFFDIDEFLYIYDNNSINNFLQNYINIDSIFVNWRIFGDNNLTEVVDNNYSITRFTKCSKKLDRLGKHIVNLSKLHNNAKFYNPHIVCTVNSKQFIEVPALNPNRTDIVRGGNIYYSDDNETKQRAELYHFRNKTYVERYNKRFNKPDAVWGVNHIHNINKIVFDKDFIDFNMNEIENINIKDFLKK